MISPRLFKGSLFALVLVGLISINVSADVTAKLSDKGDKVAVTIDGQPFAEYLTCSGTKPIVYPIVGPGQAAMTRAYPIEAARPDERDDHIHHRSLWFTHGTVILDGEKYNFWHEKDGAPERTVHREFEKIASGPEATIVTRNDWMGTPEKKVLEDRRTFTFGTDGTNRWIDVDLVLTASEGPVTFGDDKEGCMGIRMASPLKPDAKKGGKLVNSHGQVDKAAWGKRASWVDYSGKIDGKPVGFTFMNHPSSFRYPTNWHARTYGLCAANPFAWKKFGEKDADGTFVLEKGKSIRLSYRFLFHPGDSSGADRAFEVYAEEKKN